MVHVEAGQAITPARGEARPGRAAVGVLLVAWVVGCWILLAPPSAGPDEPSHLVRGAALVRGQWEGEQVPGSALVGFDLPAWVGFPDPSCYAFQPTVAASCAAGTDRPTGEALVLTKAADYPIWGQLLPGLATFGPAGWSGWTARVASAVVPVVLVGTALTVARSRGRPVAAAGLLALTPMAWFTLSIVNPSAPALGGAVALWIGALDVGSPAVGGRHRWSVPLVACGWAALVLSRRDGLVWAVLVAVLVAIACGVRPSDVWRALTTTARALIGIATALTVVWGLTGDDPDSRPLVLVPVVLVLAELAIRRWQGLPAGRPRLVAAAVGACAAAAAGLAVLVLRPGGFDGSLAVRIAGQTGDNLVEAIGVLGWLDTAVPTWAVSLLCAGLGLVLALALIEGGARRVVAAAATLATVVAASWVLELYQGNESGTYWQGRYSLPLLVGIPIVLAARWDGGVAQAVPAEGRERLVVAVRWSSLVVVNAAFVAAARRWGVGVDGSRNPFDWDTYGAPIAPVLLVGLHAGGSLLLYRHHR